MAAPLPAPHRQQRQLRLVKGRDTDAATLLGGGHVHAHQCSLACCARSCVRKLACLLLCLPARQPWGRAAISRGLLVMRPPRGLLVMRPPRDAGLPGRAQLIRSAAPCCLAAQPILARRPAGMVVVAGSGGGGQVKVDARGVTRRSWPALLPGSWPALLQGSWPALVAGGAGGDGESQVPGGRGHMKAQAATTVSATTSERDRGRGRAGSHEGRHRHHDQVSTTRRHKIRPGCGTGGWASRDQVT